MLRFPLIGLFLLWALPVLSGCFGAGFELEPVPTRVAFVGSQLSIPLKVTGAQAPVRFGFESDLSTLCRDGRCRAGIRPPSGSEGGRQEATFEWVPGPEDLGTVNFQFSATDGSSSDSIGTRVEVRSSVGYEGLPQFIQPLGTGATLDLSQNDCFEFDVVVSDPDSLEVEFRQLPPLLEGSELNPIDGFSASFRWCPRPEDLRLGNHRQITVAADDGESVATKEYLLVARRPAKADCAGDPPALFHEPVHHSGIGDLPVRVRVESSSPLKHAPLLYYSSEPIPNRPNFDELTQLSMELTSGDRSQGDWEARIPNPTRRLPEGASTSIYYFMTATNPDESGGACDQHAQAPRGGAFEVDIVSPGETATSDEDVNLCSICTADRQCGTRDDLCVRMGTRGRTYCLSTCRTDGDCEDGYSCSDDRLVSVDGTRARQCIPDAGSCEAPVRTSCGSDAFEDNDTRAVVESGRPLAEGSIEAVSCIRDETGDDDWYRIDIEDDGQVQIDVSGESLTDIDLALVDEDGEVLVTSESTRSDESISRCLAAGTYYIRVFAFGVGANPYRLDWSHRPGGCEGARCEADDDEDDSSARRAREVDLARGYDSTNNTICRNDDDWYVLYLDEGQTMAVELTFIMASAEDDLDIHFYNEDLVDLTPCSEADPSTCTAFQGQSLDSNEYYDHTAEAAGTYYLVVHGFDGAENNYDIRIWEEFF